MEIATPAAASTRTTAPREESSAAAPSVDFESFLRLLTAQLRYQDPLSPLESTEFVSQLASFSSVEQLVKANERLDAIAGKGGIEAYAGWIGREAGVEGAPARFTGAPIELRVTPDPRADRVEVAVYDAAGVERARFAAANVGASQYWDGSLGGAPAPEGDYAFRAIYYKEGEEIARESVITFTMIEEVSATGQGVALKLQSGQIVLPEDVIALRSPL
jgi:flagellar basal-body rod modification protein FlgD